MSTDASPSPDAIGAISSFHIPEAPPLFYVLPLGHSLLPHSEEGQGPGTGPSSPRPLECCAISESGGTLSLCRQAVKEEGNSLERHTQSHQLHLHTARASKPSGQTVRPKHQSIGLF